jgi:hypothetical protein
VSAPSRGRKTLRGAGILAAAALAVTAVIAVPTASASATRIYNNIPAPLPGNLPSEAFEAQSASEFGGQVSFDGTARHKPVVRVGLSSWGCQSGHWNSGDCSTAPKSTFSEPITVKVYSVGQDNEPGNLLGSVTHTVDIPYRPSANYTHCTGADAGKWWDKADATCYNGKLVVRTVRLGDLDLPDTAIVSVAYDTTHYGYNPIGESAPCYSSAGGCGYDALNVALNSPPTVGSDPLPDDAYLYSTWGGAYCDGGASGTGTFRLDAGCWTGFQPAIRVSAR